MSLPVILSCVGASLALAQALAVGAQRRQSVARWAFVAGMLTFAGEACAAGFALSAENPAENLRWHVRRLAGMSCSIAPWVLFSLFYARGSGPRWPLWKRIVLAACALAPVALAVFAQRELIDAIHPSEFAFQPILSLALPGLLIELAMLIGAIAVLVNLERTFRAAVGTVRWRVKFMLAGVGLLFTIRLYTSSHALLFRSIDPIVEVVNLAGLLTSCLLIFRSLVRSGHFEIDVYPSPAVLRGSITFILAGVYLVITGFLWNSSTLDARGAFGLRALLIMLALGGLVAALQSDRVKWFVRRTVSRHFQRPFYDYRATWRSLNEATAAELDQAELCRIVVKRVADLLQAKSVAIWLVADDGLGVACAASSLSIETEKLAPPPRREGLRALLDQFSSSPEPVDFENSHQPWSVLLRELHPKLFKEGGNRVVAPLTTLGHLLGFLLVGDRLSGGFGAQDLEILRCVTEQTAGSLLNIQLAERAHQQRELAAFQAMATFFVHDLKNAASTLNLMLPNLPVHWNNPEFRDDALRGINKTVAHINTLVQRLGQLRKDFAVNPRRLDVNDLVQKALAGWQALPHVTLVQSLGLVPAVQADKSQLETVLLNLLLNARDAVASQTKAPGRIQIRTRAIPNWAVVTVADNGCGMTKEFVANSLFKPFQTTKKDGLGIGMFQSRMIVEAHGGRLTVESTLGVGTSFDLYLPLSTETLQLERQLAFAGAPNS